MTTEIQKKKNPDVESSKIIGLSINFPNQSLTTKFYILTHQLTTCMPLGKCQLFIAV